MKQILIFIIIILHLISNDSPMNKGSTFRKKINSVSRISHDKLVNTYNSGFNLDEKSNMNLTYNLDYKNKKKNLKERNNKIGNVKDIKLSHINSERNSIKENYNITNQIPNLSCKYVGQIKDIFRLQSYN